CGGLAVEWGKLRSERKTGIAAGAILGIVISSSVVFAPPWRPTLVYPHYLAYFNELAGGPRNGYKRLVDSNLDWGQDLKGLKRWADEKRLDATHPLYLSYFGTADPRYYQIPHINLPGGYM